MKFIDTNAAFGVWPIQYQSATSLELLDGEYARVGVDEVWLSAVESILAPEPDRADIALFSRLTDYPRFRPVKTVNPLLANWRSSLERACQYYPIVAIKLFPNYHGYNLGTEAVDEVCHAAKEMGLPVLVQMRVNDERNQPPCLEVDGVSTEQIATLSKAHPELTVIALSPYLAETPKLAKGSDRLLVDISFLDGIRMLQKAKRLIPASRIVFGTGAAWMLVQPAVLKLEYSDLPEIELEGIASANILARTSQYV